MMPIELSREELYERVWTEPIQKLSKEYGLSDVGLAKACRRYNIPIPPRGYWAKKQASHRVDKAALPPDASAASLKIQLPGASARATKAAPEPTAPAHPLIAAESDPAKAIVVPDDLRVRHPLLQSTREHWRLVSRPNFRWDTPLPPHINMAARAIQELAGHADLTMTQRYMHLSPAALDSAIRLLEQPAGPVRSGRDVADATNGPQDFGNMVETGRRT